MAAMSQNKGGASAMPSSPSAPSSVMSDSKGNQQTQATNPIAGSPIAPQPTPQAAPQPVQQTIGGFAPARAPVGSAPTDLSSAFMRNGYQPPQQQTVPTITQPTSPVIPGAPPLDQIQAQTAAQIAARVPAPAPAPVEPVKKEPRRPHRGH